MKAKTNLTMLCDFYELTMANGYFQTGLKDRICYFDVFYRTVPDQGGFALAAGLAQVVEYIQELRFDEEDLDYLRSKGCFSEEFLDFLRDFRFTGDMWAVPEGTPVFPGEPLLTVRAPAIQAQFVETFLLLTLCGVSVTEAFSGALSSLGNAGPALDSISTMGNYSAQPALAKLIY